MKKLVMPVIAGVIGFGLLIAILRFGNLCQTPLRPILWFCGGVSQVEPDPVLSCGVTCHSQDDCPEPLWCAVDPFSGTNVGVCRGDGCSPEICSCVGYDLVCPTRTITNELANCLIPAGECTCSGPSLSCPSVGIGPLEATSCYTRVSSCGCNGPDYVCNFHGETVVSRRNAPSCQAAPPTTVCYQLCDPAAPSCDPGLTCTRTEDGANRCMGGVDTTGYDCTTWPSFSRCFQPCDPDAPLCDPGLTCSPGPNAYDWCIGGVDSTGRNCPSPTSTSGQSATSVAGSAQGGACFATCDPDDPTGCLAGLSCLPRVAGGEEHICYNEVICNPDVTQGPNVTQDPGVQTCTCGDGVCEQNRCSEFQQNCPADCGVPQPPPPQPGAVCGDGACNGGETCLSCSADCGPC